MGQPIKTFWCEVLETGYCDFSVKSDESLVCPNGGPGLTYHIAHVDLPGEMKFPEWEAMDHDEAFRKAVDLKPKCRCGFEFNHENARSFGRGFCRFYRRVDTGEIFCSWQALPAGASWDAECYHDIPQWCGPDGISLQVKLPDGVLWNVDGVANNCTRKDDKVHKCWVRHGDPKKCEVTVDKGGNTCAAGAGSILTPRYHGFLRNGFLVDC